MSARDDGTATPSSDDESPDAGGRKPTEQDEDAVDVDDDQEEVIVGGSEDTDEICSTLSIPNGRIVPDMLIVLDRSISMKTNLVNRWDPSVRGLKSITSTLDGSIRFGLMAFPGRGGLSGGGGVSCAPGTLEVPLALDNADAIAMSLDSFKLIDTTPTAATLTAAHASLRERPAPADGTLPPPYVILVTDGAPNCGTGPRQQGGAVEASVRAIDTMAKDGIKTYVLGYGTQQDLTLKSALDQMARAGGTGDAAHRPIEDEASLIQSFREITRTALGCDFLLEKAPSNPSYVLVELGGERVPYDAAHGWTLSADRRQLSLRGDACTRLLEDEDAPFLSVEVQCEVVQAI